MSWDDHWERMLEELDEEEHPDLNRGDIHVLSDQDVAERCAEIFAHARMLENVDEHVAADLAEMCYDLFDGEWSEVLGEHDEHDSDYRITD